MPLVRDSLTSAQKTVLHTLYTVEAETVDSEFERVVGRVEHIDEAEKIYKQLRGFSMAGATGDGGDIDYEDPAPIHRVAMAPTVFSKGVKFTPQMKYTDQFAKVSGFMGQIAGSFVHRKNQTGTDLLNLGFTSTTMGANSEELFKATHDMGGVTFSNLLTGALSPNSAKTMLIAAGNQKSAQDEPMPYTKSMLLMGPPDLTPTATEIIKSLLLANTANNNTNEYLRTRLEWFEGHYFTSTTAWYARAMESKALGTVFVNQMPFGMVQLPQSEVNANFPWFALESFVAKWFDAHNVFGSTGL